MGEGAEGRSGRGALGRRWGGRALKAEVGEILRAGDFAAVLSRFRSFSPRQAAGSLFSFFCQADPVIRFRAVTALGVVAGRLSEDDMEGARVLMRRCMWNLNDESGGVGWGCAEAMGEMAARVETLAREYAPILLSYIREDGNPLDHPGLLRGALWGCARLAEARPRIVRAIPGAVAALAGYCRSPDPELRGLSALALGRLEAEEARPALLALLGDEAKVRVFAGAAPQCLRVRDLAAEALSRVSGAPGEPPAREGI